jgi:hypothetical protein
MNKIVTALICGGALVCGAQALADDASTAPTMTNSKAVHKKLMQDCVQQQKSQNSASSDADVRKTCQQQVRDQMQRMNDAGTVPKSSVPNPSSGNEQTDSAYSDQSGSDQSGSDQSSAGPTGH